jgi:hypothetical protein
LEAAGILSFLPVVFRKLGRPVQHAPAMNRGEAAKLRRSAVEEAEFPQILQPARLALRIQDTIPNVEFQAPILIKN